MICLSEEFQRFVIKTGRVIERALTESVDIYMDYIGGSDADDATYVCATTFKNTGFTNTVGVFFLCIAMKDPMQDCH